MDNLDKAFINGFIKAGATPLNSMEEALEKVLGNQGIKGVGELSSKTPEQIKQIENSVKMLMPPRPAIPASLHSGQQLNFGLPDYGGEMRNMDLPKKIDLPKNTKSDIFSRMYNKVMTGVSNHPFKTGAGLGGAGVVGGLAVNNSAKPGVSLEESVTGHAPGVHSHASGLFESLKNSIQQHPVAYAGGAAGLGGLGYILHNMHKNKKIDEQPLNDQPGGDPDLVVNGL